LLDRFRDSGSEAASRRRSGLHIATAGSPASTPSAETPRTRPIAVSTSAKPSPTSVTVPSSSFEVPTKLATYRVAGSV
jgi:hypothetical protein